MTKEEIKKRILKYKWEHWADRPFGAFILSLAKGNGRKYMRRAGIDAAWPGMIFQKGSFYKNMEGWDLLAKKIEKKLKRDTVFEIVRSCEAFSQKSKRELKVILKSNDDTLKNFEKVSETLYTMWAFCFSTHILEHIYAKKLRKEVGRCYSGDQEKFIGDISYPKKQNTHAYFEKALASNEDLQKIKRKFGWIKARDGFSEGFTIEELKIARDRLKTHRKKTEKFKRPPIPPKLRYLSSITQELVYFRTMRTDVIYEYLSLCRPFFKNVAKHYNISYNDFRNYDISDLLRGKLRKYNKNITMVSIGGDYALFEYPILKIEKISGFDELKGNIAYKGKARGTAKIVMTAYDIGKIETGDILVSSMTTPALIIAMQKAAAFVTDEGGITCHAAIIAREMKKPCIIGTKIATKVLKDGDLVEVDAEKGVVKILK